MHNLNFHRGVAIGSFAVAAILILGAATLAYGAPVVVEAPDTNVRFPWGDYVAEALIVVGGMASYLVATLKGLLPGPARWAIEVAKIDQVIERSIQAAVFDAADDLRNKSLTLDVKHQLLAATLRNIETNARGLYNKYKDSIGAKARARLEEYITKYVSKAG